MCQSCGRQQVKLILKYQEYGIWQCVNCKSFVYLTSTDIDPTKLYDENYFHGGEYLDYTSHQLSHEKNAQHKWSLIQRHQAKPLRVLELGCAYGYFVNHVRHHGAEEAFGLDVNAAVIKEAQKAFGPYFAVNKLPQPYEFNCLTLWDVWEHLSEPLHFVGQYIPHLPEGGLVALTTVDAGSLVARLRGKKWRQIHPPTHLHYPTRQGIKHALESLGLKVVYQNSFSVNRAFEVYWHALGFKANFLSEKLRYWPVPLNLHDIQIVIARKE